MGFIGDLFSGSKGAGYQAQGLKDPLQTVDILQTATPGQWQSANQYQNRLNQYGADAFGQGQAAARQQRTFLNDLNAMGGTTNLSRVFRQGQDLANQLSEQAQGRGPNPALAQLQQTTGQNVANQAALMASQRGSSANPALMARQAAQQGAATQQQAAGQGAILRANQQLAAQQALQNQQNMLAGIASGQIGAQQSGLSNYAQLVNAQNSAAQGLQGQNLAQQKALMEAINEYNKLNLSQAQGINNANVSMQSNINDANAGIARANAGTQGGMLGGLLGGIGSAIPVLNQGGMVKHNYADGGEVNPFQFDPASSVNPLDPTTKKPEGPQSMAGKFFNNFGSAMESQNPVAAGFHQIGNKLGQNLVSLFSPSKAAPATPTSNLMDTPNKGMMSAAMNNMAYGYKGGMPKNMREGGAVKGKAKVKGDSLKNDTVHAMLSPKEIVIPRSITLSENAPEKAAKFVAAILAREGMKR